MKKCRTCCQRASYGSTYCPKCSAPVYRHKKEPSRSLLRRLLSVLDYL